MQDSLILNRSNGNSAYCHVNLKTFHNSMITPVIVHTKTKPFSDVSIDIFLERKTTNIAHTEYKSVFRYQIIYHIFKQILQKNVFSICVSIFREQIRIRIKTYAYKCV